MRADQVLSSNKNLGQIWWPVKYIKAPLTPVLASVDDSVLVVHSLFADARFGCGNFL